MQHFHRKTIKVNILTVSLKLKIPIGVIKILLDTVVLLCHNKRSQSPPESHLNCLFLWKVVRVEKFDKNKVKKLLLFKTMELCWVQLGWNNI